jgi:hypothetical protein
LERHQTDERTAGVFGKVEFADYWISVAEVRSEGAIVEINVEQQTSLLPKGIAFWKSGGWQEHWRLTRNGWVFADRIKGPSGILFVD